jgi:hypothetical protein
MPYRKLSPELHEQIIRDPRPYKDIAESLGVHKHTVGRIKRHHQFDQLNMQKDHHDKK